MIKVKRLSYAHFESNDVERQARYYKNVLGLREVARDGRCVYLGSRVGILSIVLEKGDGDRCTKLGFEVAGDIDAATGSRRLSEHGIASRTETDPLPGIKRILSFKDPKDTTIELFNGWSFLENGGDPAGTNPAGVGAYKLGHIAFYCTSPQEMAEFYGKVMGFRVSDWISDYFVFMRCGIDHHAVNFLRGPVQQMQHIAFELRDHTHLLQSCDVLGRERHDILWGPVRHGPGHNVATYHRNPADQIVELFCDMDVLADEELEYFEPRPWHRERPQKPRIWKTTESRDIWGMPPLPEFRRPQGFEKPVV